MSPQPQPPRQASNNQWLYPCPAPPRRTWQTPAALGRDLNCAAAAGPSAYDVYLGDESAAQQASAAMYLTEAANMERKHGWELLGCSTALHYICEVLPDRSVNNASLSSGARSPACCR